MEGLADRKGLHLWGRLPIFVTWRRSRHSSYPHVRETSHIFHVETFPSFFIPSCEGDFPYSSCGDVPVILHTLMWGRLPIFVTWIRFRYSSYPHVRETSHIRHMETFPSFFMPSCEGDFPYSSCGDVPVILHTLVWGRLPIFITWRRSRHSTYTVTSPEAFSDSKTGWRNTKPSA